MSYLVLARKWRPETFPQVVGQKHVVATLAAAVRTDRIAHAYLFTGPRGVGKTTVARILAKALNCEKGPTDEPCLSCASCTEVAAGRSLDVIEIDGASNRRIEDARSIRETVQYAPLSGRKKVYIIDEAHMLTREAFNALLKTLEEPPAHVVFILATTEASKIPDTIASRCQRFDFHRVGSSDIEARLSEIAVAEKVRVEPAALRLLALRADGSMRDAQSLFDQLISAGMEEVGADDVAAVLGVPRTEVFGAIVNAVAARDTAGALRTFASALDAGFDPRDVVDGLVEHLRDLLVAAARAGGDEGRSETDPAGSSSAPGPPALTEDELVRLLRIAADAQAQVRWSTQASLMIELALARMARLSRTVEIEDVVRALRGGGDAGAAGGPGQGSGTENAGGSSPARAERGGGSSGAPAAAEARRAAQTGAWCAVIERVREQKAALGAFLCEATASDPAEDGGIDVLVPNGSSFHRQQLQDKGNMALLERAATEVYGRPVRIRVTFAEQQSRAPAAAAPLRKPAAGDGPPSGSQADATVRKVLEMFDGEITGTRKED
jgi:DNA polymerase-3 subunit gamma/tau